MSGSRPQGGYRPLAMTPSERRQIEEQLCACFELTPSGASAWVDTSLRLGHYYGWKVGEVVAASVAFEPLAFAQAGRAGEPLRALLLQSHYVHPDFRGRGYRIREDLLDEVLARHGADLLVLCLYEDGLARYWAEVGFVLEYGRETVTVGEALARWASSPAPLVTPAYRAEKLEEAEADGASVTEAEGLVLIRARGSEVHTELLVTDLERARAASSALLAEALELTPIMTYPERRGLFCPVEV